VAEGPGAPGFGLSGVLRNLSLKAVSQGLDRLCRLLVVVAAAPVLGEASFGRFVFASTLTTLLALGTDLVTGVWTTREIARGDEDRGQVARVGLTLRAMAAVPYSLAILGVCEFAVRGETRTAIFLLAVAALANAFVDHFGAILRGYERFRAEASLSGFRALVTTVAGLGVLTLGHSLSSLCVGLAIAGLVSGGYGTVLVRRFVRGAGAPGRRVDGALARVALRESLPIWFAGIVSVLYFKVDTLFLRFFAGDAELGAYGAAYKFFEGSMILPSVLIAVAFPRLARAYGNPHEQRGLEQRIGALLLGLGLLAGGVCWSERFVLVRLVFGAGFDRASAPLSILAFGLPLLFLNFGLTHFLLARDRARATLWLAVMMLGLNVGLDIALIPRLGGVGAAGATVVSELALTLACLRALGSAMSSRSLPSVRATPRTDQRAA
jgi:O-antigen/teichoic acid export membrane protein